MFRLYDSILCNGRYVKNKVGDVSRALSFVSARRFRERWRSGRSFRWYGISISLSFLASVVKLLSRWIFAAGSYRSSPASVKTVVELSLCHDISIGVSSCPAKASTVFILAVRSPSTVAVFDKEMVIFEVLRLTFQS